MRQSNQYFTALSKLLDKIESTQMESISKAAEIVKEVYKNNGIIHLFGAGHSHMPTEEVFVRAGSLTFANAIWPEKTLDAFERVEGLGKTLLSKYDLREGEAIFVFSNSGINPLPIEVALEAKKLGLKVIAITAVEQSRKLKSRQEKGKKLFEVADIVIDNCVPYGDTLLTLHDTNIKFGPASTISSVSIINAIFAETIEKIYDEGLEVPVRISKNIPGGDEHNQKFIERYADRIPELRYRVEKEGKNG